MSSKVKFPGRRVYYAPELIISSVNSLKSNEGKILCIGVLWRFANQLSSLLPLFLLGAGVRTPNPASKYLGRAEPPAFPGLADLGRIISMDDQHSESQKSDVGGQVINGRYQLHARIGRGATGDVYEAHDSKLDRLVAVKVLRTDLANDRVLRMRFEREARAAGKLSHNPNVVTVFDVDDFDGQPFMVMELVSGGTLASRIKLGPLPPAEAISVARQVLGALAFAHSNGIVHRDIKPSNILMNKDGQAKVSDFGIARIYEGGGAPDLTLTSDLIGTPAYLSPERIDGKPVTPSSDIFSVGVVLYEMVTGQRPFKGDSPMATLLQVRSGEFTPPEVVIPNLPEELTRIIKRCLARLPEDRYSSAQHMAEALDFENGPADTVRMKGDFANDVQAGDSAITKQDVGAFAATQDLSFASLGVNSVATSPSALQPWYKAFWASISVAAIDLLRFLGLKYRQSKRPAFRDQPLPRLLLISAAVVALLVASLFLFGGGTPPSQSGHPTISTVATTSSTSTTIPSVSTTFAPSQVQPSGPPGLRKKGR